MTQYQHWKPAAYTSLSPYLVVSGAQKVIDFVQVVFGAKELRRYDRPDGAIMHAEVRIDDSVLMLSESDKRGMVMDPCGNTWVLSTQKPA